jgi:hypothetical protein
MAEPDHHITRTGDDYAQAMQALLPIGQAWPRGEDTVLMRVVKGPDADLGLFRRARVEVARDRKRPAPDHRALA